MDSHSTLHRLTFLALSPVLFACFEDSGASEVGHETSSTDGTSTGEEETTGDGDETSSGEPETGTGMDESETDTEAAVCGDGVAEGSEDCDDANDVDGDGCDADCTFTELLAVEASTNNTCVLIEGGRVRCWGANEFGQLGYGHVEPGGDDEQPWQEGDVMIPSATELTMGAKHVCVRQVGDDVRCWGSGGNGRLGYGSIETIGDDETPTAVATVQVGGSVLEIDAGGAHTCARLNAGRVRCWGWSLFGAIGYGSDNSIGNDETPSTAGDVNVGSAVMALATGDAHTCAAVANGAVRCWGLGALGRLGYGNTDSVGIDDEPANAGDVSSSPLDEPNAKAVDVALGFAMTCALYDTGSVLCWGANGDGQLGQGMTDYIGDDDLPSDFPAIELPEPALAIDVGDHHACALLESGDLICWGDNEDGQLGRGDTLIVGDDESPADAGVVELDGPVRDLATGGQHTCAILAETNELRCWGRNEFGQLGLGNTITIGDDESPMSVDPVQVF